jgi:hypothetical protein
MIRMVPGIAPLFEPLENKRIQSNFLPMLLGVELISAEMWQLMANGVKQAGLGIWNLVEMVDILFVASKDACQVLTDSLVQGTVLNLAEHKASVRKAREQGIVNVRALEKGQREEFCLQCAASAGIWRTCFPSRLQSTELSAEEFIENIRLCFNLQPLSMDFKCDGCGNNMTVEHALSCKVGGLVHIRHDNVAEEWAHLSELAVSMGRVTHKP